MNNLLKGIMDKFSGSAFSSDVGGRIYLDEYGDEPPVVYPHCVFFIVSGNQEDTFKSKLDDVLVQFSLFSTSKSATEITGMYNHLIALLDDAALSITSSTCVWCVRQGPPATMVDEITTPQGTSTVKHWVVEYSILVET